MNHFKNLFNLIVSKSYIYIVASIVEAPRIIYSFESFRENRFAAICLALLSTYALSQAFESFFKNRNRKILLILGIISIILNILIIAPVISFLLQNSTNDINLPIIFNNNAYLINIYAITISLSTFWPLLILSCVHGYDFVENLNRTITITNNDHNVPELNFSTELLTLSNLLQNLEKKLNSIDSKADAHSIEFEKRLETIVLEINQRIDSIETTSSKKEIKQNNQQNDGEDSFEEVTLNSEIINLLRTSPKTVEELAAAALVDLKTLENGPRWGILRKLTKSGIIKKVGNLYELVEGN